MSHDLPYRPLLACHNLAVAQGGRWLLDGIGFTQLEGSLLLVRGANGAGKTSFLRTLAGLLPSPAGEIRWRGEAIESSERYSGELLYIGHRDGLKTESTVGENLLFWAAMYDNSPLLPVAAGFLGIETLADRAVRLLSAGQRKRVALSRLLLNPQAVLWLLDEPATHLDEDGVRRLGGLIASRLNQGGAVVMSAHQLPPGLVDGLPAGVIDLGDYVFGNLDQA